MTFLANTLQYHLLGILYFCASMVSIAVGTVVLVRNPRSNTHLSFFLITLSGSIWLLGYAIILAGVNESVARFGIRLDYLGVPFITTSVYWFIVEWTRNYRRRPIVIGLYLVSAVFSTLFVAASKEIFTFRYFPWGRTDQILGTTPGIVSMVIFLVIFFMTATAAVVEIFLASKRVEGPERTQYRYFLVGFVLGYTGSIDFASTFGINFPPLGFISFTAFISSIAFLMIRHHFLDINLLLKRISLISLIYAFLSAIALPVLAVTLPMLHQHPDPLLSIITLGVFLGFVFSLGPVIYAYLIRHTFWLHGHVTTGLTHELKSPLGAIQGATDILIGELMRPDGDRARAMEYAKMIEQNSARLDRFVRDLLSVARIQDGMIDVNKERLRFRSLVDEALDPYLSIASERNISVLVSAGGDFEIHADRAKVHQILSNVLSNAFKFSEGGEVAVRYREEEGRLMCAISDQGCGIPRPLLERIFDRFYKVDPASKGSGVGLAIAKAWVEAHGGRIWAESGGLQQGTTVTFTVPLGTT